MKCFKHSAKSIGAYVFIMFCFVALLFCGSQKVYAEEEQKADLYKNGTYMGNYKTMDAAFAKMTDSSADYEIFMSGNQTLTVTSWPKVKSITIDGGTTEGEWLLELPEGDTVLNSNVTLKTVHLTPVLLDRKSYHCTNVNIQDYTFTVDGEPGIYTTIGYIWDYSKDYGYYINLCGGTASNVVFQNGCQMLGTLNVNTVSVCDRITLWSPYNKGSNIQNCIEDSTEKSYPCIQVRTFGEASRLCIQNADSRGINGVERFNIETGNSTIDSDCLVTIQNLSASGGIYVDTVASQVESTDIRVESGLSGKSVQISVSDYAYFSESSESNAAVRLTAGTKMFYAPDFTVGSNNVYATYEKNLWKTDGQTSSQCSSFTANLETYKDANGYLCIGEIPTFSLDQYNITLTQNESTVINVTAKSSSVSEVNWSASGNISVSGDLSKATIQSNGAFNGSERVSYSVKDKNGNYLVSGWNYVREKSTQSSESGKTNYITTYNGVDYSAVYDYNYYINKYADLKKAFGTDDAAAIRHFVNGGMAEGRQAKESFDVQSYRNANADLRLAYGNDLVKYYQHYMKIGKNEGRKTTGVTTIQNPITTYNGVNYALVYDFNYYCAKNPDIKKVYGNDDIGAIRHFVLNGMKEGRQAKDSFDVQSYKNAYADLRLAYGNDLTKYYQHYMRSGKNEGRKTTGVTTIQNAITTYNGVNYALVYDFNYYCAKNPDIKKVYGNDDIGAIRHFVLNGMKEGRQAKDSFDVQSYKNANVDLRLAYGNDLVKYYQHYMRSGKNEGRKTTGVTTVQNAVSSYGGVNYASVYNYNYYCTKNPDVKAAYGNDDIAVLQHFIRSGMAEGRQASEEFNVYVYQSRYPDVKAAYGDNLKEYYLHYMRSGKKEGRSAK